MKQTVEKLKEYISKYRLTDTSCHHEENTVNISEKPSSVIADKISAKTTTKHDKIDIEEHDDYGTYPY
jgi:hypothetical protein